MQTSITIGQQVRLKVWNGNSFIFVAGPVRKIKNIGSPQTGRLLFVEVGCGVHQRLVDGWECNATKI